MNGGYPVNTVASFSCNSGYQNGANSATCEASGNWNEEIPTCEGFYHWFWWNIYYSFKIIVLIKLHFQWPCSKNDILYAYYVYLWNLRRSLLGSDSVFLEVCHTRKLWTLLCNIFSSNMFTFKSGKWFGKLYNICGEWTILSWHWSFFFMQFWLLPKRHKFKSLPVICILEWTGFNMWRFSSLIPYKIFY